ncbi:MAG TPA: oligosaccharide flippase family protein, partial [Chloroflexia bacterium]|nr:oligosaccharide flippase family protein [Chloroflexia bacterium]
IPELSHALQVMGVNLVLFAALLVPAALLRKRLQFGVLARSNLLALVLSGAVAVAMAASGFGYWALVGQSVLVVALRALGAFRYSAWRPHFAFDPPTLRPLLGFSSAASLHMTVNYWGRNVGNLLIARFLGAVPLGQFNLAGRLLSLPVQLVSSVLQPLLHPSLAALGADLPRVRRAYGQIVQLTGILSFAVAAYLWVIADRLVPFLWGAEWAPSVAIFYALVPVAAVQPVNAICAAVFMARDATRLLLMCSVANAIVVACGMAVGLLWGVEGVAWGYSISYVSIAAPLASLTAHTRLLNGTVGEYAKWLLAPLAAGASVLAGSAITSHMLPGSLHPLASIGAVGIVAALSLLLAIRVAAWPLGLLLMRSITARAPAMAPGSQELP